jgi:hypothetical protein
VEAHFTPAFNQITQVTPDMKKEKDHFAPKRQKKINITPAKKIWKVKEVSGSPFYPNFNNITRDDPYIKEEKDHFAQKDKKNAPCSK